MVLHPGAAVARQCAIILHGPVCTGSQSFIAVSEQRAILLLRVSYWTAAVADFVIAALLWMPARMGVAETVYPMGFASVIAFSWGVLLLMADRRPVERRWILLPTMLVVLMIAITRAGFSIDGTVEFSIVMLVLPIVLIVLMGFSYYYARGFDHGS